MQANMVELIRELMKTQQMSIRKISARIAKEQGGSALGYTQQINRILNDPDYDPTFSTVQKILSALNYSFWQMPQAINPGNESDLNQLNTRLDQLSTDVAELKMVLNNLHLCVTTIANHLAVPSPPVPKPIVVE